MTIPTDNQQPSREPGSDDSMAAMLRSVFKKLLQDTDGQLPAEVVSYDRTTNTATVRPTIAMLTTSGQALPRAAIARVPVLALGGGDVCITFPLKPGDTGWIEASDRDISLWLQSGGVATPNTLRFHTFESGRFIPDLLGKFKIPADVDADADMVIQTANGANWISIGPSGVAIGGDKITIGKEGTPVSIAGRDFMGHTHVGGGGPVA